jgi:endoglucanase
VADKLLIERDGHLFILPGMQGFHEQGLLTLNGSYWVFPALEAFADAFPSQPWSRVMESGHWLLAQARFGEANLPPDWLELSESGLDTSRKFPPRYGYDAVRIPLHLAWSRTGIHPEQLAPFETFWQSHDPTPAWINLQNNHLADHPWSSGMSAIATLARQRAGLTPFGTDLPQAGEEEDYFSWSLSLLSHIAAEEMPR